MCSRCIPLIKKFYWVPRVRRQPKKQELLCFSGTIAGFEMLHWHRWDSPITLTSFWLRFPLDRSVITNVSRKMQLDLADEKLWNWVWQRWNSGKWYLIPQRGRRGQKTRWVMRRIRIVCASMLGSSVCQIQLNARLNSLCTRVGGLHCRGPH